MRKAAVVAAALFLLGASSKPDYPVAAKRPVTDSYGSVKVTDDYRWLEDASDAGVKQWVSEENKLSRAYLDAVPGRAEIARRLEKILLAPRLAYSRVTSRAGRVFAMKSQPPKEQPVLVMFDSVSDPKSEHVIFDPTAADANGATAIDFYVPTLDARRVAISLSEHGS